MKACTLGSFFSSVKDMTLYLTFSFVKGSTLHYQEEEAQIVGVVLVTDLKSLGWNHVRRLKPLYVKRIIGLLQVSV